MLYVQNSPLPLKIFIDGLVSRVELESSVLANLFVLGFFSQNTCKDWPP